MTTEQPLSSVGASPVQTNAAAVKRRRLRRDKRGRFTRREPDPVGPATMAALMRAYALGDEEGVRVIVGTCDPGMLIDRLLEATVLMGQSRYGSRHGLAAAMGDMLGFLAMNEASGGRA